MKAMFYTVNGKLRCLLNSKPKLTKKYEKQKIHRKVFKAANRSAALGNLECGRNGGLNSCTRDFNMDEK